MEWSRIAKTMPLLSKKTNQKWKKYKVELKSDNEKLADLYDACKEGRNDIVKLLVTTGKVNANQISSQEQDCQGLTALHITARYNQVECMRTLVQHGADVNIEDKFGFRPIHDCALYGYLDCLTELLSNGAQTKGVRNENLDHITPLFYAAQQNHVECVKLLKLRTESNDCLIWDISSKRGNVSLTRLTEKENIVNKSLTGWLQNSALSGHARYLHRMREVVSRKFANREALQSIQTAAQHGHLDYLEQLLEQGIDANIHNKEELTPLHYAARYGHEDCIKLLVKHNANTEAKSQENFTPLHTALRQGCIEGVATLLECGASVNESGGDSHDTPVHMCLKIGAEDELLKEILRHKPDLTLTDANGKKPTDIKCEFDTLNEIIAEYVRN